MASLALGLLLGPLLFSTEIISRGAGGVVPGSLAGAEAKAGCPWWPGLLPSTHKASTMKAPRLLAPAPCRVWERVCPSQTATPARLSPGFGLPGHCFKKHIPSPDKLQPAAALSHRPAPFERQKLPLTHMERGSSAAVLPDGWQGRDSSTSRPKVTFSCLVSRTPSPQPCPG